MKPRESYGIRPSFSPDGSKIVFGSALHGEGDIYLMNSDGSQVTRLTKTKEFDGWPAFSPDGKRIVYVSEPKDAEGGQIYVMNADGSNPTRLTKNNFYDMAPSFSPDGSKIVFLRAHWHRPYSLGGYTWDHWDIYVMNADGTNEKRVTQGRYYEAYPPYFSPDGKWIVFGADVNIYGADYHSNTEVFVVDADGRFPPKQLTRGPQLKKPAPPFPWASFDPSFSPDGKKIVFISDRAIKYDYEVWIMNADGSNPVQVTRNKSYNRHPTFSPDGKKIIFVSEPKRDGIFELWEVDVDGRNLRRIARRI